PADFFSSSSGLYLCSPHLRRNTLLSGCSGRGHGPLLALRASAISAVIILPTTALLEVDGPIQPRRGHRRNSSGGSSSIAATTTSTTGTAVASSRASGAVVLILLPRQA
ncbi:unnamed protein product, partial [Ectocarpus sp. 8 AP-2014]